MEVGSIASGLGYSGEEKEKDPKFDLIRCVDCLGVEASTDAKDFIASWNISTHLWLKNYVYLRMLPTGKRGGSSLAALITFMVSGIWHGFYPGFIHFFFWFAMGEYNSKLSTKVLAPRVKGIIPDWL